MLVKHITVADKIATFAKRDGHIVCGNSDYKIVFAFDDEWSEYTKKTARFIWNGLYKDQEFEGNECPVPILKDTTEVEVGVFAGDLQTTTSAVVPCKKSVLCSSPSVPPEEAKVYRDEAIFAAERAKEAKTVAETSAGTARESASEAEAAAAEAKAAVIKSDTRGYYYSYIDLDDKKIYLTESRVVPEIGSEDKTDTSFATPAYPVGGKLCLVNNTKFDWGASGSATIAKITNNVIEYEGDIGFDTISTVSEPDIDDYTLFVIEAPLVGAVKVREGARHFGYNTSALGNYSVAEGRGAKAIGNYSHAEGNGTSAYYGAHSEGRKTEAVGEYSHAEGNEAKSVGDSSHAEGMVTKAIGPGSHAEGLRSQAIGERSHAEGQSTEAHGLQSHAEGNSSQAIGNTSHAEGYKTEARGYSSHTEGVQSVVEEGAVAAHAEGQGTVATKEFSHVQGQWNERDAAKRYVHIQGWGASDSNRKNIHTVDTNGNAWYKGGVYVGGSSQDAAKKLATEEQLNKLRSELSGGGATSLYDHTIIIKGNYTSDEDGTVVCSVGLSVVTANAEEVDTWDKLLTLLKERTCVASGFAYQETPKYNNLVEKIVVSNARTAHQGYSTLPDGEQVDHGYALFLIGFDIASNSEKVCGIVNSEKNNVSVTDEVALLR